MTVRITMHGAGGRMGRSIMQLASNNGEYAISGAVDHDGHPSMGEDIGRLIGAADAGVKLTSSLNDAIKTSDVVIDFSNAKVTPSVVQACLEQCKPLVIGTTGLDDTTRMLITELAAIAPVVVAPNMSVGVNVMLHLASKTAQLLGDDFDIEVVEMHHKAKVDAPSGTAQRLYEVLAEARGLDTEKAATHGRSGVVGARPRDEIGMHALRGGDVIGDHTVVFAGPGERIELTHRAHTREIFAAGALRAARWVVTRPPGLYGMNNVLGL